MENIRLAFQGIWGHKMRSFLTMLGIIIGIASIITIVSTIKGTNEQIKQNLIGAGNNVVTVQLYQSGTDYPYDMAWNSIPDGVRTIEEETRAELEQAERRGAGLLLPGPEQCGSGVLPKHSLFRLCVRCG